MLGALGLSAPGPASPINIQQYSQVLAGLPPAGPAPGALLQLIVYWGLDLPDEVNDGHDRAKQHQGPSGASQWHDNHGCGMGE